MKKILFAVAAALVASLAIAGTASADVPRYQPTATLTVSLTDYPGFVHTFTIAWADPCAGAGVFSGTGNGSTQAGGATETITGALVGHNLTFTAIYTSFIPGYTWTQSSFAITWDVSAIATFRNHGAYVNWAKSHGIAASEAARSCIGRPLPFAWSASGTIDSASPTGTTVTLPDNGTYRIDVSGTYLNSTLNAADAEYTSLAPDLAFVTPPENGYDVQPYMLGEGFGDVQINGSFVNWGAFSPTHAYSLTMPLGGSVTLGVFDGYSATNSRVADWYTDNNGALSYTVTYVGP